MPSGAVVSPQGDILTAAPPPAASHSQPQPPAQPTPEALAAAPKAGDTIDTPQAQTALRAALVAHPLPQGAAPLPQDATPQQAFQAFERALVGKRFRSPLGDTVTFNEGHFGRVTCASDPDAEGDPARRKGFIAGHPSAQAARQALREGRVSADQIHGYQPGRAALIPLIPDLIQHPQYIVEQDGTQLFVKRYTLRDGRTLLAVLRKFGDDLRLISFHPAEIKGGKLQRSRVLFAEDAANLQWSAGPIRDGTPSPSTDTVPQSGAEVKPTPETALGLFDLLRSGETQVRNVPVADIQVNRDIKQFKRDADPRTGVVAGEALEGEWQPIPAKPILLLEKPDGTLEVVTGRHRLDLARRNGLATIPANVIRMADGWTLDMARALDAYDNILDEKGSDQDFIQFFRDSRLPRADAQAKGLLARRKGRDAYDVAEHASEDLYALAMGDARMDAPTAAAIAREAPQGVTAWNANIQRAVARAVLDDGLRADDAAIMARSLRQAYAQRAQTATAEQLDLFGADDTFILAMTVEAKFAAQQIRQIDFDLRGLKTAAPAIPSSGSTASKAPRTARAWPAPSPRSKPKSAAGRTTTPTPSSPSSPTPTPNAPSASRPSRKRPPPRRRKASPVNRQPWIANRPRGKAPRRSPPPPPRRHPPIGKSANRRISRRRNAPSRACSPPRPCATRKPTSTSWPRTRWRSPR